MMSQPEKKFYKDGIQFQCQGTGKCCMSHGTFGYVYLTLEDRKRLAAFLEMRASSFTRKHCEQTDGLWHLKDPDKEHFFLKGKKCSVYEGRPLQCRTWPFWPENINSKTWNSELISFCAGVNKGRRYTAEEIEEILKLKPHIDEYR
jgi:uncharacterized protein